jgi:hypothetical protein
LTSSASGCARSGTIRKSLDDVESNTITATTRAKIPATARRNGVNRRLAFTASE